MHGLVAITRLIVRRALAAPALALIRLIGVLIAVALVCAVSLYASTMGDAMLQATLSPHGEDVTIGVTSEPADATAMPYETVSRLDGYLRGRASTDLGLPIHRVTAHFQLASPWQLAGVGPGGAVGSTSYGGGAFEYLQGLAGHARLLQGRLFDVAALPDGSIPVAVTRDAAASAPFHLGQRLALQVPAPVAGTRPPVVTVAAIFVPLRANDPFWQSSSPPLNTQILETTSPQAFARLAVLSATSQPNYNWQLSFRRADIHFGDADRIARALTRFNTMAMRLAPGTTTFNTIAGTIHSFATTFALLNVLLYLLAAPVVGIVLYYLLVSTELVLNQQAGEIVLLRSRGATTLQIVRVYAMESALMGLLALGLGTPLALPIAYWIGRCTGFLQFAGGSPQVAGLTLSTVLVGAATALVAAVATMAPVLAAARRSMSGQRREQARSRYRPFWRRVYLDLALLAVTLYGYVLLTRQGAIAPDQNQSALAHDPFVGLAPTFWVLAGTLLFGRLLPPISAGCARLFRHGSVPLALSVQTVARTPQQYVRLGMLLCLTLSIGVFAASVASTIGANLDDQYRYQTGANLRLVEDYPKINQLLALPTSWHQRRPGVRAASPALRFESYQADVASGDFNSPIEVLGVDPATFGEVAWFRPDFAAAPLDRLLAPLGAGGARVLVNDRLLAAAGARVGDQIEISITGNEPVPATIVGSVHYFPTLNPPEGYYAIANLASLQQLSAVPGPSEMWLRTDRRARTTAEIIGAVQEAGRVVVDYEDQAPPITIVDNPLQVGIYGVTSIGFLIAATLSMLGLVSYLFISLDRRAGEFGVLRALGNSVPQLATMLLLEQFFLVTTSVLAALAIGLGGALLFIPYLPIAQFTTPPFLVTVRARDILQLVLILLVAFALALAASAYAITRVQISKVLRLGDR